MSDLERLINVLDALNIAYEKRVKERREQWGRVEEAHIDITLADPRDFMADPTGKVHYGGYSGFAWIFTFDVDGTIREVGGYE